MKTIFIGINAKYVHTNLAIRYLQNSCSFKTEIAEYNINQQSCVVLQEILQMAPDIIGFSCYIWNIDYVLNLCCDIKKLRPNIKIILGGPQVSFSAYETIANNKFIDYIICGEGEAIIEKLIVAIKNHAQVNFSGVVVNQKGVGVGDCSFNVIKNLDDLCFPYSDIVPNKIIYYETSRGCPFSCSYCLSGAMGCCVRYLSMERIKSDLKKLCTLNVPIVKLVDRTFNANKARTKEMLNFMLENTGDTRFHFEIGADLLDEQIINIINSAPVNKFQIEAGVQSCNKKTLETVVRKTDMDKLKSNIKKLIDGKKVHVHLDLIAGLPFENLASFENSFNEVYDLHPHMLQLGFLKILDGSKLKSEVDNYGIVYREYPPFEVLCTNDMSCDDIFFLKAIEEVVDRYYNSGRFYNSINYLVKFFSSPFDMYSQFVEFCKTSGFINRPMSSINQFEAITQFGLQHVDNFNVVFLSLVKVDYLCGGAKGSLPPSFLLIESDYNKKQVIKSLLDQGKITRDQQLKNKFDILPININTLKKEDNVIMIDSLKKDEITGMSCFSAFSLGEKNYEDFN